MSFGPALRLRSAVTCALRGAARTTGALSTRGPGRTSAPPPALLVRRFSSADAVHVKPLTALTDDERALQESVAKFAKERIGPLVSKMDEESKLEPQLLKDLFAQGLMGIEIPETHGGNGMSFMQAVIAIEELAKVDPAISVIVDIQNTLANTSFRKFGSAKQQQHYLPRLASDTLVSFCLSEASSGSDAFALKTRAQPTGDGHYLINGTKMWISNSAEAQLFIVFANANPELGYKGITAFIVERDAKGLRVGKKENKLGIRASSTCEVIFEDVKVHESQILGEKGKGYKIAIELLNEGRIGIGAQMVGLAQGSFEATMPYLFQRKQFGKLIGTYQGMQFSYAQARTDIEAARLMVYNAARLKDAGLPFIQEAAMCKLFASQVAERVASQAVEWVGGVGFTKEFPQEKFFRDAKIGAIYEGTTNLQLQTIAGFIEKQYNGARS